MPVIMTILLIMFLLYFFGIPIIMTTWMAVEIALTHRLRRTRQADNAMNG